MPAHNDDTAASDVQPEAAAVKPADLLRFADTFADLGRPEVMAGAWDLPTG